MIGFISLASENETAMQNWHDHKCRTLWAIVRGRIFVRVIFVFDSLASSRAVWLFRELRVKTRMGCVKKKKKKMAHRSTRGIGL